MEKKKSKKNAKSTKILSFNQDKQKQIVVIGSILVLIVLAVILVVINQNNQEEKPKEDPNQQEESPSKGETIAMPDYYSFMGYLNLNSLPDEYFGYFYTKDKIKVNDIPNQIKIYLAIRKIISEQTEKYAKPTETLTIPASEVETALEELFGTKINYKHESLEGNTCSYSAFKYNKSEKAYIQEPAECIESGRGTILSEIVSTEEGNDKVVVTEKIAFITFQYNIESKKIVYSIFKDVAGKQLVGTASSYGIQENKDDLDAYKYTFERDKSRYVLSSIERVK